MQRPIPWLWIGLAALLLLAPGPAGRLLLDLVGGLTVTFLLLPLLVGVGGFVAWQVMQRRVKPCPACGFVSAGLAQCPACGANLAAESAPGASQGDVDARTATVDVEVEVVEGPD